jgi:DNA-binding NtrC family response regulator
MPAKLLIVDVSGSGEPIVISSPEGAMQCECRNWGSFTAADLLRSTARVLIVNASPSDHDPAAIFSWIRDNFIQAPVLALLPQSADPALLQAVSEVADDFIIAPIRADELNLRVARIPGWRVAQSEEVRQKLALKMGLGNLVGQHASFLRATKEAQLFASSTAAVLITGETGTGKELFAHAIHSLSSRRGGPFIPVDCGGLPEHLAENELFGHSQGAFTDARKDQKGLAALAEGGTLFLDEVDALSLSNQAKLLRILQEGTYRPLGAERFTRANIRIVAATNRSLEEQVRQKQFRSDLFFRLNVLRMELPPLRERRGDVTLLARHFLENECAAAKSQGKNFSAAALRKLEGYQWPGNVRELFNTVQRAFVIAAGRHILPDHISLGDHQESLNQQSSSSDTFQAVKHRMIEQFERTYLEELLDRHQGNITQAAREAGKDRRALGRMVKKYRIATQIA